MKWYIIRHSDPYSRVTYEVWSEQDANTKPNVWNRNGRRGELSTTCDTVEEALSKAQEWEEEAKKNLGFDP